MSPRRAAPSSRTPRPPRLKRTQKRSRSPRTCAADGSGDPTDDLPKAPDLDEFDIAYEVARLLENRRWDKREEPFQGFDSPPGKF